MITEYSTEDKHYSPIDERAGKSISAKTMQFKILHFPSVEKRAQVPFVDFGDA